MISSDLSSRYRSRTALGLIFKVVAIAITLWGCSEHSATPYQGYVEGEFVLVASPLAGQLKELSVRRGDQVDAENILFALDQTAENAAMVAAEQEVQRAASRLTDLRKGQRPSELHTLEALLKQAQAAVHLSEKEFSRRQKLVENGDVAIEDFDRAAAALAQNRAQLETLQAQLETARLGARVDVVAAGQAELNAARARLAQAQWASDQKAPRAQQAALVFDTLFEPGEFVRAGYPVVSLLPPANIIIRFFVPEASIGRVQIGQPVTVAFDGSDTPLPATVTFISPQAEYTPPVIYSRDTRAKLVFLVEAHPAADAAHRLHPGQPVDVRLGEQP